MWVSAQTPTFLQGLSSPHYLWITFEWSVDKSVGYPQAGNEKKLSTKSLCIVHKSSTADFRVSNGFSTEKSLICAQLCG